MGENGTSCDNLQIFCGKMGATLRQNPQKTLFPGPGGLWGGVLRHMSEEKWGKMGENGGKWGKMGENGDVDKRNVSQCLPLHLLPASFCLCALWPTKCTCLRGCAMSPSRPLGLALKADDFEQLQQDQAREHWDCSQPWAGGLHGLGRGHQLHPSAKASGGTALLRFGHGGSHTIGTPTTMIGALFCRFFGTWIVKEIIFPPSSTN